MSIVPVSNGNKNNVELPLWEGPVPKGVLQPLYGTTARYMHKANKPPNRKIKFLQQRFSINALESLIDTEIPGANEHEKQRALLLSLPRTLKLASEAALLSHSQPSKAIEIYEMLIQRSCLLDNKMRKSFQDTGGAKRIICSSSNPRRFKTMPAGNYQTDPQWISLYPDESKSERCGCYQCAALSGDKDSLRQLGVMFFKGFCAEKDHKKAVEFWQMALPQSEAYFDLAQYFEGSQVVEEDQKSFDFYVKAAEMNHPKAMFEVGIAHLVTAELRDLNKAVQLLTAAADSGIAEADLELGELYSSGLFCNEDPQKASFHYIRGAENGNAQAQWIIAQAYESGYGVEKSFDEATYWYFKAAGNEHPEAQRTLGYFYEVGHTGDGILEQDFQKAFYWYERASAHKDMIAMFNLSNIYWKGKGIAKNLDQAIYWCTEAAEQGDTAAQVRVAEMLKERNDPTTKDERKMIYWLDMAANENNHKAQFLLGKCFMEGTGVQQDTEEALAWYNEAANGSYAEAQYTLSNIYKNGENVHADDNISLMWCSKAADQGHPAALSSLARMYETGKGCAKNIEKAVELYHLAVTKNDPSGQFYLGFMYQNGSNLVPQDFRKAFDLYLLAAEQGEKRAQSNLGSMYKKGIYVQQDFKKAFYWFRKSAEQNHPRAQANLGLLYENGLGVERDYEEAAKWYYKAACRNNEKAQLRFALLCQQGLGVRQNEVEAVYWFENAAKQGNAVALYNMGRAYEDGVLVEQDYAKAVDMYQQAVQKGNSAAKLRLANMFEHGTGVPKSMKIAMEFYSQAAVDGVVEAQVAYAVRLEKSKDIPNHQAMALQWFEKAAQLGSVSAQFYLGKQCLKRGEKQEAIAWFQKSAASNHIQSHLLLCSLFEELSNIELRNKWLISAAALGNPVAQCRAFDILKENDKDRALDFLKKSAEYGLAESQYKYGVILLKGELLPVDYVASSHWLTLASNQGYTKAQILLAESFQIGRGVAQSLDTAIDLFREAVINGAIHIVPDLVALLLKRGKSADVLKCYTWARFGAECKLDKCIETCQELETRDKEISVRYVDLQDKALIQRKLAWLSGCKHSSSFSKYFERGLQKGRLGNILSYAGNTLLIVDIEELDPNFRMSHNTDLSLDDMYRRAVLFYHGRDRVPQDYLQARHWYTLAAQKGHAESRYMLANLNILGLGSAANVDEAIRWYTLAADSNYLPALKALGAIYSNGKIMNRNLLAAYCFLMQAFECHNDKECGIESEKLLKEDENIRRQYRELKNDAIDERQFAILSGFSHVSGSNSNLYTIIRKSPCYTPKIARLVVKFVGDANLVVRQGEDMVDFLRIPQVNIKELESQAIAGDKNTQYSLAMIYLEGTDDVKPNMDKAGYWFACAARQDHADSFYRLAQMYDQGIGFKQDIEMAIEMYESAAHLGHIEALRQLGSMAKTGRGIEQDFLEAYCWFQLAYQFGDITVKKELEFIESQEKKVKREYQDLKGTALSQRRLAFLSGFHFSSKDSILYSKIRIKLKEIQGTVVPNSTLKCEADIIRMVLEFSADTLLLVNPGIELMDFLRKEDEAESDHDRKIVTLPNAKEIAQRDNAKRGNDRTTGRSSNPKSAKVKREDCILS